AATYKSKKNWDLDCDVKNGLYLWKLTLDSDNKITSVEPFQYDNEDSLFMVPITFPTDKALEVKTTNEYVQIDEDYYTLADQVYVYLFDKDKKLTVKNLNFLDGLRTKKYGGIVLFDTIEKNEEFNIIVVVENADNMPGEMLIGPVIGPELPFFPELPVVHVTID
ncbi:MAG: hypothetical protein IJM17_06980, partial [Firmicutes bacterium]|nr:hypothetical protein [Bacillota bacterium]